ncbi:MAG TPA: hypothetical protein VFO38_01805 [Candidatus Saccharimonadales bacterium]|nr:hypothetical protein [Candidatus Saccharimonadales bacterium]
MSQKIFHLQPWTPKIREAAHSLINKIHTAAPELEILFMGAAALGLPGKNDIDLDILCHKDDISSYTKKLLPILGVAKEANDNLAVWNFKYQGFDIDAILSDPTTSHVPKQQRVFEKLRANPNLLNEYRELKVACNGLSYATYEKRKKLFFTEKVLGQ